jgi:hypothetical protein
MNTVDKIDDYMPEYTPFILKYMDLPAVYINRTEIGVASFFLQKVYTLC